MARIPDAFIDDLLARTDIVEVVNARVPLKRQGKEYASRCPFHDERSASFTVSPTKQFYHCFGCGAHGTAISFVMNYDRLEFLDAVDELAKRVGMEIPRDTQQRNADPDTRDIYSALDAAAGFFRSQLATSDKARAYVDGRGIDPAIVEHYAMGYAPDGFSALRDALGTDPRRMQLLERGGMFSKNERGNIYDKFRDRLMFPIHDRRGRVIAFGGRVIDPEDSPKYLNSPETPLFHKGRELYGLWQAKQANPKLERLIVVEGYMDVVALFAIRRDPGSGDAGHRDHARPCRTAVPQRPRCVLLLRWRPCRPRRRVEGAGVGAATDEGWPPGDSSCSCPTARIRIRSCARRAGKASMRDCAKPRRCRSSSTTSYPAT